MPAKSKRNRRNISSGKNNTARVGITPAALSEAGTLVNSANTTASLASGPGLKKSVDSGNSFLVREIMWIGVVTGIVLVLLMVAFYIFR